MEPTAISLVGAQASFDQSSATLQLHGGDEVAPNTLFVLYPALGHGGAIWGGCLETPSETSAYTTCSISRNI